MQILIELLIACALVFAMALLWRESRRKFFSPIKLPRTIAVCTVVSASGSGEGLEQLVGSLLWLHTSAGIVPRIIIEDCGLDSDGTAIARLLERDNKAVVISRNIITDKTSLEV
ncbi:MAG: hypothetical protein GX823_01955 [Clostridiales bacterium]|nr:hypothetical protein [Clostridiales bacterium]